MTMHWLTSFLLIFLFNGNAVSYEVDYDRFTSIFSNFSENIEHNTRINFKSLDFDPRVCKTDVSAIQEATIPWEFEEGHGYIHVSRIGPMTSYGGASMTCEKAPAHVGPAGSYLKGFWFRTIDFETLGAVGYPPIHHHHSSVRSHAKHYYGDRVGTVNRVCHADQPGGAKNLYRSIMDCTLEFCPYGLGEYIPEGIDTAKFHAHTLFILNDIRESGSPPFQVYLDSYSFWLTDPKPGVEMRKGMRFEMDASVNSKEYSQTFTLPPDDDSITFTSNTMNAAGQIERIFYHSHTHHGDEGWIVRGLGADILDMPQEGEYADFAPYHEAPPTTCERQWRSPPRAFPLSQVPLLKQHQQEQQRRTTGGKRATATTNATTTITLKESKQQHQELEPEPERMQYEEAKELLAAKLGDRLLCRYQARTRTLTRDDVREIAQATTNSDIANLDRRYGDRTSRAGRTGWIPNEYYMYWHKNDDGCDKVKFEAGEVITLIGLSSKRGVEFRQHSNLVGVISFDDGVSADEGCIPTAYNA